MCVLKCGVWSLKKAGIVGDKLCWWPLNLSTLHNYTCIKIGKFIDPKSAWDITELLVHPSEPGHGRGSAPYGQSDSTSRPRAGPSWTVLNDARAARSLSSSDSLTLLNMAWTSLKLREAAPSNAPVRWTLTLKTNHLWSLRPCQSRKITEQRIQRLQSRELSRWRHAAVSSLHTRATEEERTDHVTPRNKELNSRGKTKPKRPACFNGESK